MSEWPTSDIPEFYKWWNEHGQFLRAGGGQYEITFAYEAYKAALVELKALRKDAERYRWLQKQRSKVWHEFAEVPMNRTDEKIDAAIAAKKEKP